MKEGWTMVESLRVGFDPDEVRTDASTRQARLKWVIAVDAAGAPGRIANAVACLGAATEAGVAGLLGPEARDADDSAHPGLPWAGVSIVAASSEKIASIRAKAAAREDVFVADMPAAAQTSRVYDEYRSAVAEATAGELGLIAVAVVGPRKVVDRLVGGLKLYG